MALDNINCPQFVDFTSIDTFNINDGADFCFDKGLVGEMLDLGDFTEISTIPNPIENLSAKFKDATNLNKCVEVQVKSLNKQTSRSNVNTSISKTNKENDSITKPKEPIVIELTNKKPPTCSSHSNDSMAKKVQSVLAESKSNIVKKTLAKMGAAMMMNKSNKHPENLPPSSKPTCVSSSYSSVDKLLDSMLKKKDDTIIKKTPPIQPKIVAKSFDSVKQRSSSLPKSLKNDKTKSPYVMANHKKPPIETEVKKQRSDRSTSRRRSRSHNDPIIIDVKSKTSRQSRPRNLTDETKPICKVNMANSNLPPKINNSPLITTSQLKQRKPSSERAPILPLYQGLKFIPKHQNNFQASKPNSLKSSSENLIDIIKNRPASLNRGYERKLDHTSNYKLNNLNNLSHLKQRDNSHSSINRSKPNIENVYLEISKANSSILNSAQRKHECTKPSSLLHTEIRALRRLEYENSVKDKERLASLIKKDLETDKMRKQRDEIKKLRSQSILRVNPIRQYKPLDIKPSNKPLTNPKSPVLSTSICQNSTYMKK